MLDTEATLADERARAKARRLQPEARKPTPDEALVNDRTKANVEGPGQEFRADIGKSTLSVVTATTRALGDPTRNEAARTIEVAALATKRMGEIVARLEVRRDAVAKRRAEVAAQVDAAYQSRNTVHAALGAEIRTMLRGMDDKERDRVLSTAKENGDYLPLLYAIAGAPAALSGVSFGQQYELRRTALAIANPELLTLPAELDEELTLLDACEEGVRRTIAELVDFDKADALKQLVGDPA